MVFECSKGYISVFILLQSLIDSYAWRIFEYQSISFSRVNSPHISWWTTIFVARILGVFYSQDHHLFGMWGTHVHATNAFDLFLEGKQIVGINFRINYLQLSRSNIYMNKNIRFNWTKEKTLKFFSLWDSIQSWWWNATQVWTSPFRVITF